MLLKKITTTKQFLDLESSWDCLTVEPLRSFDWHFAWWSSLGKSFDLNIYSFEVDGQIVGIAPFFVDRWMGQKRLRFLGSGTTCTDYAEIIVDPAYRKDFVSAIASEIRQAAQIKMIELEGVCGIEPDDLICDMLVKPTRTHWRYDKDLEPTWKLDISKTWEQFVASSKKSLRRKVKKAQKRLSSGEMQVRSTMEGEEFEFAFGTLVELHQDRFNNKGLPGVFADDSFTEFLRSAIRTLAKKRSAEILIGFYQDKPIAAQLYLLGEQGPQLYQGGVRTDAMHLEPGHLMFTYAVRKSIERGYSVFDFLRGSEPYKSYWGAVPQKLINVRCVSRDIIPTTLNQAYRGLRSLKQVASKWIPQTARSH